MISYILKKEDKVASILNLFSVLQIGALKVSRFGDAEHYENLNQSLMIEMIGLSD